MLLTNPLFGRPFWPFHSIFLDGKNSLKMVSNDLKMIQKNNVKQFDFANFEVIKMVEILDIVQGFEKQKKIIEKNGMV